ncbi:hypothetical protein ACJMK2_005174 [Sinanodonta woodiana]|uniref:CCHC-type domain-containing protein n=1 Tax=Sinanodonta woodiana TaxID=1069815 RepID=A0ABD3VPA0_SINWO
MTEKFKVSDYFNTTTEDDWMYIPHYEGCLTLDFGNAPALPRQTEVLTALKILGVDIEDIMGLQYAGINKYTLYPSDLGNRVIEDGEIEICGHKVEVRPADPMVRKIEPRMVTVYISGIPLELSDEVLYQKLWNKYGIRLDLNEARETCYGFEGVQSRERIIKVPKSQLSQVPPGFYCLGWLARTWYKGCEEDQKCPRCKQVGHAIKNCTKEYVPRPPSYANAVIIGKKQEAPNVQGKLSEEKEDTDTETESDTEEGNTTSRRNSIDKEGFQSPKRTARKVTPQAPLKIQNKYEGLPIEEMEEGEQEQELEEAPTVEKGTTEISGVDVFTSTPKPQKRKLSGNLTGTSSSSTMPSFTDLSEQKPEIPTRRRNKKIDIKIVNELNLSEDSSSPPTQQQSPEPTSSQPERTVMTND